MTRVSAVVPNHNGAAVIGRCVEALAAADGIDEIVVVDDASSDDSPEIARGAGAHVVASTGRGFSAAVNRGIEHARNELVLILNSDVFVARDAVARLAATTARDARIGLCGAGLVDEHGVRTKSHGRLLTLGRAVATSLHLRRDAPREAGGVQDVEFVPLACVLARRTALDEVGALDERFFFYFEDHDLCWRIGAAGWRIVVDWDARAVHLGGASSLTLDPPAWFRQFHESRMRYLRKRYPRAWPLYAAVWAPSALVHAGTWIARGHWRWAAAYARAAVAGL